MEDDIIKETDKSISLGMGIRVIDGNKTGYGYTNNLTFKQVKETALTAASIASHGNPKKASKISPSSFQYNRYPIEKPLHQEELNNKIELVKKTYETAQNFDKKVLKVNAYLADIFQQVTIINSDGLKISDTRPLVKLVCKVIAEDKGKREAGFSGGGGRVGMEHFLERQVPVNIGKEAAQDAIGLLDAEPAPAGEMPVVLAPGHSGVLVHEAVGHLLEADFNRKKTSIFWNKMGQKVGSSQLTIYDDPTIPFFRGSYNIDDEGTIPQKTLLIEKGILKGLLQDRLSASLMNKAVTGHGRRKNYTCIPIPRMSNTYIDKGEYQEEEIIQSVKKGFYAQKYQGGQVEDSGKFTFSVSSGFLIENGKITVPLKQATLIGTNIDILSGIDMVGNNLEFSLQTGTCGKEGQSIPVTDGCPTIKIKNMVVGGYR